ncbi:MAG TPA: hypothetical protein DCW94_06270 [Porticoccaceae bacterium]|jgi:hypothetical protein|nr:hypothetical protein [Porticoccaceae bacterium]
MTNQIEHQLETALQQDLHHLENETEARDVFRLAQARNRALSQNGSSRKKGFIPTLGASLASILLVAFFFFQEAPVSLNNETVSELNRADSAFEFDDENVELYEDLDFYYWLADNEQGATG